MQNGYTTWGVVVIRFAKSRSRTRKYDRVFHVLTCGKAAVRYKIHSFVFHLCEIQSLCKQEVTSRQWVWPWVGVLLEAGSRGRVADGLS
jgi:hypothetical protein